MTNATDTDYVTLDDLIERALDHPDEPITVLLADREDDDDDIGGILHPGPTADTIRVEDARSRTTYTVTTDEVDRAWLTDLNGRTTAEYDGRLKPGATTLEPVDPVIDLSRPDEGTAWLIDPGDPGNDLEALIDYGPAGGDADRPTGRRYARYADLAHRDSPIATRNNRSTVTTYADAIMRQAKRIVAKADDWDNDNDDDVTDETINVARALVTDDPYNAIATLWGLLGAECEHGIGEDRPCPDPDCALNPIRPAIAAALR